MNRDTVIASLIGFGFGLVAAIGIWVVPKILPKTVSKVTTPTQVEASPTVSGTQSLEITSPKDGQIVKDKTLTIQGKAKPNLLLTFNTPSDQVVSQSNSQGEFSTQLTITEGANQIEVAMLSSESKENKTIYVYYVVEE